MKRRYDAILEDLLKRDYESSWFEFKENWFDADKIGQYISGLSNAAKIRNAEYAYMFWGVNDRTHEVVGTKFDFDRDVNGESLEHYLLRKTHPDLAFKFDEFEYRGKRIVVLLIPAARNIPTSFDQVRYIRVGSSLESLLRYPEREAELWACLNHKEDTIETAESKYRDLKFNVLFNYYAAKGIILNRDTFESNLGLLTADGKYNVLAQLLSDNSFISIRAAVFAGKSKSDPMFSVKEFGMMNILLSLDKVLDYADTFNIPQADERNRMIVRKEVLLFDMNSYREAVINAFVHNDWLGQNAPMFLFFSDRIEILSNGALSPKLTLEEFYKGKSEPVNKRLSDIFVQLHISERTGRGVHTILRNYGRQAFEFTTNSILVTMPFRFVDAVNYHMEVKSDFAGILSRKLTDTQKKMLALIGRDPHVTIKDFTKELDLGHTAIQSNLTKMKNLNIIERVGSKKSGVWKILI